MRYSLSHRVHDRVDTQCLIATSTPTGRSKLKSKHGTDDAAKDGRQHAWRPSLDPLTGGRADWQLRNGAEGLSGPHGSMVFLSAYATQAAKNNSMMKTYHHSLYRTAHQAFCFLRRLLTKTVPTGHDRDQSLPLEARCPICVKY